MSLVISGTTHIGVTLVAADNPVNDASVTNGKNATAAYVASQASGGQLAAAVQDPGVITVTGSNQLIDPGIGACTIAFLAGASADTLVLHAGGVDQVSGFDPSSDVLDLGSLLAAANVDLYGDTAALGNYLTIADQGSDALVAFDPTGHAGGSTIAVLQGSGGTVTGLATLIAHGAIRIT